MDNHETFKMTYSAQQQEELNQIRKKYAPRETDKMEQLRALDASVTRKASCCAITVGILGTLLMGIGMSLCMSDLGNILGDRAFPVGIVLGTVGIGILACAYPLYHRTLKKERERVAPQILKLTDELMQ